MSSTEAAQPPHPTQAPPPLSSSAEPASHARGLRLLLMFGRRWARRGHWLAAIGLLALLGGAWLWPALDQRALWPFEALNYVAFGVRTLAFHFGLGVLGMIGVALCLRQWWLGGLVLLPMACFLLLPDALWIARSSPPAVSPTVSAADWSPDRNERPEIIIYSHNAFLGRVDVGAIARAAREHDADVIVVQEASAALASALRRALGEDYPHWAREDQSAFYGHTVLSRLEFAEPSRSIAFADPPRLPHPQRMHAGDGQQRLVVRVGAKELVIQNIHLVSPSNPEAVAEQGRQVVGLVGALEGDGLLASDAPAALLIGDFNSTPRSAAHGRLRAGGLREVHAAVGATRGGTWPAHSRWAPAFLSVRIDNAWVNAGVIPRFSRVIGGHGSDHRGIVVGLDLRDD